MDAYTLDETGRCRRKNGHIVPFPTGDLTMDRDLEPFLIALYVIVDDLYQRHIHPMMPASRRRL